MPAATIAADDAKRVMFKGKETCSSRCIAEKTGVQLIPSHAGWEK